MPPAISTLTARGKSRRGIRPSLHPGGLRCYRLTYSRYAPSSRLVRRAQERSRCSRDFHHGLLATVLILMLVAPTGMAQPSDVKIYPKARESTRLAVANFVARTAVTPRTRTAAKVFNDVLWQDLKFSAFFEMPSKSFYPLKPLRSPQDVSFDHWQAPTLDVDFLAFGNLHVDAAGAMIEGYLYDVKTRQQVLGKRYSVADATMIRRVAHQLADQIVYQLSAGTSQGVASTQITYSSLKSGEQGNLHHGL